MDNLNHRLFGPATRNAVQRLALGSLYLSLLFVLLSVSFVAPMVSEVVDSAGFTPDNSVRTPELPADNRESASREG